MPITQDRMIALTNAALDFQQALETLANLNDQIGLKVQQGAMTKAEAYDQLNTFINPRQLLGNQAETMTTIALESRHWHRYAKRNVAERLRQRKRRGTQLLADESAHTAPRSLAHTPATRSPQNILRETGMVKGIGDYIKPQATQAPKVPPMLAEAGANLPADVKAAIDREVAKATELPKDVASAIADDLDDPTI